MAVAVGRRRPAASGTTAKGREALFQALLRTVAGLSLLLVAAVYGLHEIGGLGDGLRRAPWIGGMVAAAILVAASCLYAAGDPRRRFGLTVVGGLILALPAAAQLAYLGAGTGADQPLGSEITGVDRALVFAAGAELVLAAGLLGAARLWRRERQPIAPPSAHPTPPGGPAPAALRLLLAGVVAVGALLAAAGAAGPFVGPLQELFAQPLLSAHLAAAAIGAAALAAYVAADVAERLALAGAIAAALLVASLASLPATGLLFFRDSAAAGQIELLGLDVEARTLLWIAIGLASLVAIAILALRRAAYRAWLRPEFLGATEYRALMGLSDVIVRGPDEAVPPPEIVANVDRYMARIRARRRYLYRVGLTGLQLHPLLYLKAPFSELDEAGRLHHLKTHFQRRGRTGALPDVVRRYVQVMLRMATQLTYLGYYSDRRSFSAVGYEPFEERRRYTELDRAGKVPHPGEHPLEVARPDDVEELELEAGTCVIGSGAAGAVLAYRLAEAGEDVVVLERGEYVEPREFNSDEVEMIGRLYADGVFQQSEDFRFTVLQASCVGGTTVVNNAVSIPLPEAALARWNDGHGAGIDPEEFYAGLERIERWLRIQPQREGPENPELRLNPSYPKFVEGVERRRTETDFELDVDVVRANIDGCLGCGYCNIGCRYGKKLSMLDTVLPWAQRDFGERVRLYAECDVRRIVSDGARGRVSAVEARLADGRKLTVRARKFVLAAGTVASSHLLRRSGIGKGLPVGRGVSFNMGAALTAEFDEDLAAYDGLQISHLGVPPPDRGWVLETWWNPPVSQALNMPGWFEDHYENMRRYRRLMAVGALVGTESNARIGSALTGGAAIHYVPTQGDLRKLSEGLTELGRIFFAAGAKAVMLNGWDYHRLTDPAQLDRLPEIMSDPSQVALGTGHPQGGNAIGSDPDRAVVDPRFRVHGHENLYLCDASVFPTSITVNPQLTVLSLAEYAASRIAAGNGSP